MKTIIFKLTEEECNKLQRYKFEYDNYVYVMSKVPLINNISDDLLDLYFNYLLNSKIEYQNYLNTIINKYQALIFELYYIIMDFDRKQIILYRNEEE